MKYFISDTHFSHDRLIKVYDNNVQPRPFSSIDAYDKHIIDNINDKVSKKDVLYILGDFAFNHKELFFRRKINCNNLWFIYGNHDNRNRCKAAFGEQRCRDIFCIKIFDIPTVLCHYQMFCWPGSHQNHFHLHGHTHDQRSLYFNEYYPEMRALDVSPDCHARLFGTWSPFSEQEVYDLLINKKGHDKPEFYQEYQDKYFVGRDLVV